MGRGSKRSACCPLGNRLRLRANRSSVRRVWWTSFPGVWKIRRRSRLGRAVSLRRQRQPLQWRQNVVGQHRQPQPGAMAPKRLQGIFPRASSFWSRHAPLQSNPPFPDATAAAASASTPRDYSLLMPVGPKPAAMRRGTDNPPPATQFALQNRHDSTLRKNTERQTQLFTYRRCQGN
jgi:hypothetical protein